MSTGKKNDFVEFITPIGRVIYEALAEPQQDTDGNPPRPKVDPETGAPIMHYKVTLAWPKGEMETTLVPLRQLAAVARDKKWAPGSYDPAWFRLEPFLRDGDNPEHNTKAKEELKGHVYLTFKSKAKLQRSPHDQSKWMVASGQPGIIGPANEDLLPVDVYSGSYARVSGIMFGTEYSGRKFISVRLNNVQKARDGEKLATGGRPDARSQFDPLSNVPLQPGAPGGALPSML
jgi:hypothetical protein